MSNETLVIVTRWYHSLEPNKQEIVDSVLRKFIMLGFSSEESLIRIYLLIHEK